MDGVALITGSASGIGRACALAFADEGVTRLILADVNPSGLEETSNLLKKLNSAVETVIVRTDTSSEQEVQKMVDVGVEKFGSIQYAVHCAGVTSEPRAKSADLSVEAWDRVHNINLRGVWLCQRAVIRQMLKQDYLKPEKMRSGSAAERGSIVNISSVLGKVAHPTNGSYAAAKHGVIGQSKTDAAAYGGEGIRVNSVCPGIIYTPMMENSLKLGSAYDKMLETVPISRFGKPEEIAQAVVFLASTRASYITGTEVIVDGGLLSTM